MAIHSEPGKGTTFVIKLPLSLSIVYAIVFRLGPYTFSVPTSYVASIERIEPTSSKPTGALYDLAGRLRIDPNTPNPTHILKLGRLLSTKGEPAVHTHALFDVDAIVGNMPLMVMPSGELLSRARSFAGVGIMENGDISILLDMEKL
jgi:two-component system chemotaxis sensor kinase CheA